MMLSLLPAFAMILKLLYLRKKKLYIVHLVCDSSPLLRLSSLWNYFLLIMYVFKDFDNVLTITGLLSFIGVATYAYRSFRVVYQQGPWKTLLKFNLVGGTYFTLLFTAILLEFFLSLISY